jgi:hypothetical protein
LGQQVCWPTGGDWPSAVPRSVWSSLVAWLKGSWVSGLWGRALLVRLGSADLGKWGWAEVGSSLGVSSSEADRLRVSLLILIAGCGVFMSRVLLGGGPVPAKGQLSGTVVAGWRKGIWWAMLLGGMTGGWVADLVRERERDSFSSLSLSLSLSLYNSHPLLLIYSWVAFWLFFYFFWRRRRRGSCVCVT